MGGARSAHADPARTSEADGPVHLSLNANERVEHGHPLVQPDLEFAEGLAVVDRMTRHAKGDVQAC
jgi:hypothetical protein